MRNSGLDIFRSIAILLVVLGHSERIFHYPHIPPIAYWGVDFFFVLSGFLIGRILIRALKGHENAQWIRNFLYRRWLKTIPLYYLVLCFSIYLYGLPKDFIEYFLLLRGFHEWNPPKLHSASWSLFVEEFFYLSCAILAISIYMRNLKNFEFALKQFCFIIMIVSLLYKTLFFIFEGPYLPYGQYRTMTKIDVPIYGLIVAIIKEYHPLLFQAFIKYRTAIFLAASSTLISLLIHNVYPTFGSIPTYFVILALTVIFGFYIAYSISKKITLFQKIKSGNNKKILFYFTGLIISIGLFGILLEQKIEYIEDIWFFTLSGFLSGVLLIYFVTMPESSVGNYTKKTVLFISESSYAVYLTHEIVIKFCFSILQKTPYEYHIGYGILTTMTAITLTYILCYFLMTYIEKPILAWRDRRFHL